VGVVTVIAIIVCVLVIFGKETGKGGDFNMSEFKSDDKESEDTPCKVDTSTPYVPPNKQNKDL